MNEAVYRKIDEINLKRCKLLMESDSLMGTLKIECPKCNKKTQIKNVVAVQTWWTEDAGYCIGDRDIRGKLEWDCPKCEQRIHYYGEEDKEKQKFLDINVRHFKTKINDKSRCK